MRLIVVLLKVPIFFFSFLDDLGNFKQKIIVALSKVPLLVALLNLQLIVVLQKFSPLASLFHEISSTVLFVNVMFSNSYYK